MRLSGRTIARKYNNCSDFLYSSRGVSFPIALEGALKLQEIACIYVERYPAGEMKRGPIALIDERMPIPVLWHGAGETRRRRGAIRASRLAAAVIPGDFP